MIGSAISGNLARLSCWAWEREVVARSVGGGRRSPAAACRLLRVFHDRGVSGPGAASPSGKLRCLRFDPAMWGSGLATEAVSAVTGWATENIPDRALIARIRPQNVASQRAAIHARLARAEHLDTIGEDGIDLIFARADADPTA